MLELPPSTANFDKVVIQGKGYVSTEALGRLAEPSSQFIKCYISNEFATGKYDKAVCPKRKRRDVHVIRYISQYFKKPKVASLCIFLFSTYRPFARSGSSCSNLFQNRFATSTLSYSNNFLELLSMSNKKGLEKIVRDGLIPELNRELDNLSASNKKFRIKKKFAPKLVFLHEFMREWKSLDLDGEQPKDLHQAQVLLERIAKQVKSDWVGEPIDLFIRAYSKPFMLSEKTILRQTRFESYKNSALSIAQEVVQKRKTAQFMEFLFQIEKEDKYVLSQNAIRLGPRLGFLERWYDKPSKKVMERYLALYDEFSGHMEKMARVLIALQKMLIGNDTSYTLLRAEWLSKNVKDLSSETRFADLTSSFNVFFRNTLAHKSTRFDLPNECIVFSNRNNEPESVTFLEFIKQTRELAAATVVISHIDNLIFMEELKRFRTSLLRSKNIDGFIK